MRFARRQQGVRLHIPRADRDAPAGTQLAQRVRTCGPDLEVVLEYDGLPIEQEAVARISLTELENAIDEVDEPRPEVLEGPVPLAIPMAVRHEDAFHGRHYCTPCRVDSRPFRGLT